MIEEIQNWIASFPGLGVPVVDALGPGEGAALFPKGEQVVARSRDILGRERLRRRLTLLLCLHRRRDPQAGDGGVQPMLAEFTRWVGSGWPVLGEEQTVRAEDARLTALPKEGMARYEVKLIFEFTTEA